MLSSARSGRLVARSFRIASLPITSSTRSVRIQPFRSNYESVLLSGRPFSSYLSFRQQAEAQAAPQDLAHASPELTTFAELAEHGIIDPKIIETITKRMGIHTMTDVQRMTINECLDGVDVIGQAKTGTGKTLAFLMPIVQRMMRDSRGLQGRPTIGDTRALIISPTRELAEQIAVEARKVTQGTGIQVQTAVGGTQKSLHLRDMQRRGCHILVGTPGRVKDLLSDQYSGLTLDKIQTFVLDEADRLLDIGFAPDIEEMQSYMPKQDRQTLMFSATVPKSVVQLVKQTLRPDFKFIKTVDSDEAPTHTRIPQNIVFLDGLQNQVPAILEIATSAVEANKKDPENNLPFKAIVFMSSKNEVAMTREWLQQLKNPGTEGQRSNMFSPHPLSPCKIFEMSANLAQAQRTSNSEGFRRAESAILVASDVAARGMDFPNVTHVIQCGMPQSEDQYVHRVGRTGRAGKSGEGWLFLQDDDRSAWQRNYARELKLTENTSLHTATLDMTKGAQLPANIARLMQMVEVGIRSVPYGMKADLYRSMLGVFKQSPTPRNKQNIVNMLNKVSRYGWGLENPPPISRSLADKLGLMGAEGLDIQADRPRSDEGGRGGGGRGFQRGGGRRDDFDPKDPFGQGLRGPGVGRSGGDSDRGGFGGSRGGFGERGGRGGFGGDRDGGRRFGGGDRGGFGGRDRGGRDAF